MPLNRSSLGVGGYRGKVWMNAATCCVCSFIAACVFVGHVMDLPLC